MYVVKPIKIYLWNYLFLKTNNQTKIKEVNLYSYITNTNVFALSIINTNVFPLSVTSKKEKNIDANYEYGYKYYI